jgi:ADP-ribose pyrophosphatase YjhB (NUDIX family)
MENGESTLQAASREALEEANAVVDDLSLYGVYSLTHISQVYLMFRGTLRDGRASAGAETQEVGLFSEDEIPWEELAFTVVRETLERFFEERRAGRYRMHMGDITRGRDGETIIARY